ncbi:MAG: hypothetical protein ACTTIW_04045 [Porphyromonas sp.]
MNKLFRWKTLYLLCVGIMSLGIFSACSDDMADSPNNQTQTQQIEPLESYIGKVNMAIEATVMPIGDNAARLQYILGPRELKKAVHGATFRSPGASGGGTPPTPEEEDGNPLTKVEDDSKFNNDQYSQDLAPFLSIGQIGSKIPGYLVFIYDDGSGNETVHRQAVEFEVIESTSLVSDASSPGGYKLEGKNRVRYTGDINFPANMTLNKAFENGTTSSDEVTSIVNNSPISQDVFDVIRGHGAVLRKSKWKVQAYLGYSDKSTDNSKVYFGTDNTEAINNKTANAFEPKVNSQAELHTPCISEWTDLYIAGVPNREGDKTQYTGINSTLKFKPQGLLLQYDVDVEMFDPTYVRNAGLISNALTFAGYYNLSNESIRNAYKQKNTETKGVPEFNEILKPTMDQANLMLRYPADEVKALTTETNLRDLMYPFYMPQLIDKNITGLNATNNHAIALDGTPVVSMHSANVNLGAGTTLGSRRIFTFWAMPRKTMPTTPHTYMFLKTGQETSTHATHILHQTTKDFSTSKGHVVYAKGILNSNLIFSEVLWTKQVLDEDGDKQDLSLIELYNPMAYPVRLDDYYLVRLTQKDGKMMFAKSIHADESSRETTDNLEEAYLVPLQTLLWKTSEHMGTPVQEESGPLVPENLNKTTYSFYLPYKSAEQELYLSLHENETAPFFLLPGQTLIIGGNNWFNDELQSSWGIHDNSANPWVKKIGEQMKKATTQEGGYQLYQALYHGITDPEGDITSPLNLPIGDGVALVKIVEGKRYILDATAPLPKSHLAFAGTWTDYKSKMEQHKNDNFVLMTRKDKVNFPFIPPYRTQRLTGDDWTISTDKNQFTPGWRGTANPNRTWHNVNGTWARTPLAKWDTYLNARPAKN